MVVLRHPFCFNGYQSLNALGAGNSIGGVKSQAKSQPKNLLFEVKDTRFWRRMRRSPFGGRQVLKAPNVDLLDQFTLKAVHRSLEMEIDCLKTIRHPGVVRYIDSFYEQETLCLVIEKVNGTTLSDWIQKQRVRPTEVQVLDWLLQLVDVLDYLHGESILHGDIKPENIIINDKQELRLIDFGSAQKIGPTYLSRLIKPKKDIFSDGFDENDEDSFSITPEFASPEQREYSKTVYQSDFHMLGMTLIAAILGCDLVALEQRKTTQGVDWSDYQSNYSDRLVRLLNQMVLPKHEARPSSVEQIRRELQTIQVESYIKPRFIGLKQRLCYGLSLSLAITSTVIGIRSVGLIQPLELRFYDHTFWVRSKVVNLLPSAMLAERYRPDPNITIIAVQNHKELNAKRFSELSDRDFQKQYHAEKGYSPMPEDVSMSDEVLVDLVEQVQSYQPIAIGIDLLGRNVSSIKNKDNIVGVCSHGDARTQDLKNLPTKGLNFSNIGFVDVDDDIPLNRDEASTPGSKVSQTTIRRQRILSGDTEICPTYRSLAYQILIHYAKAKDWQLRDEDSWPEINGYYFPRMDRNGFFYAQSVHDKEDSMPHEILINYRTYQSVTQNILSVQHILAPDPLDENSSRDLEPYFRDKIVLIGSFLDISNDSHKTPYGSQAGVILQAHKISHLIDVSSRKRKDIRYWSRAESIPFIFAWVTACGVLVYAVKPRKRVVGYLLISSVVLYFACVVGVFYAWCLPFVPIAGGQLAVAAIALRFPATPVKRWIYRHDSKD